MIFGFVDTQSKRHSNLLGCGRNEGSSLMCCHGRRAIAPESAFRQCRSNQPPKTTSLHISTNHHSVEAEWIKIETWFQLYYMFWSQKLIILFMYETECWSKGLSQTQNMSGKTQSSQDKRVLKSQTRQRGWIPNYVQLYIPLASDGSIALLTSN